jgi:hypothetical protein
MFENNYKINNFFQNNYKIKLCENNYKIKLCLKIIIK